mgnify:CR=1 FL=1
MIDIEVVQPAGKRGLSTRSREIEVLRDEVFCTKPFDQAFTAYYPKKTVDFIEANRRYGHSPGERALNYTKERLAKSGYRGYYVITVHDKYGSTLWHPHMMLDGRNDQMKKVERAFFPVADINCKQNGPIEDRKAWGHYCAMRACESGLDSMHFEFDFMGEHKKMRKRGSRGRGGGRQITTTIENKEIQHA